MPRKRRIPLSPGFHAEPGETKGHQHDVYTTLGVLHGWKRIHVGTLMKEAVLAWAKTAKVAGRNEGEGPALSPPIQAGTSLGDRGEE